MRRVRLGKTDLNVSVISFGTWAFGGEWGRFDPEEATSSIHRALDLGINFFDTAQAYGFGVSERLLGEALGPQRSDVVIASKGGLRPEGHRFPRDASPSWLREGVESSLTNLGVEAIDLYQVHWPDPNTPADQTGEALQALVDEGKIRHVGVSNFDAGQMEELGRHRPVETLQPAYHMFRREIEVEVLPYTADHDIGVLIYGPLAHGLLTGRMDPETSFPSDDWRSDSKDFSGETFRRNLELVEDLKAFCEARGLSLPELAVAWTLAHPAVHVAIVGARRPAQLDGTVGAGDLELSDEDMKEIDRILAPAAPVTGPNPEGI